MLQRTKWIASRLAFRNKKMFDFFIPERQASSQMIILSLRPKYGSIIAGNGLSRMGRDSHVLTPGGAMFKFGNGDLSRTIGAARTEIRAEREWVPVELPKFSNLVPNLLSCPACD